VVKKRLTVMDCVNNTKNRQSCSCSYPSCSRKGLCCECISYHRDNEELPGCYFSAAAEKTYDRSIENFIKTRKKT
jgi:hypothetical protein